MPEDERDDDPTSSWTNPMEAMMSGDAVSAWAKMMEMAQGSLAAMWQAQQTNMTATMRTMDLMANSFARLWGMPTTDVAQGDRRFEDSAWSDNPAFDLLKQTYLIASQWMVDVTDSLEQVNPAIHQRAKFWAQQAADAFSPTNIPVTNPEVIKETVRTGGGNLARGMRNFLTDLQRGRISQVPEDSYEVGKDLAITPGKIVHRNPLTELIQYEPTTKSVFEIPILVIPPWINRYYVMDLQPENSMFKHLVDAGFTVFNISWKNPDKSVLDLEWHDYMEQGPLEALRTIKAITGADRVNTVGYCLGGLALEYALAYLAGVKDETANTATYFATHQDFDDVGDISAFISEPEVMFLEWLMTMSGGYLDGRNMAVTFNMLRSNDLLWRYVIQNYLIGQTPPAFDILYWNSDGTRVPGRVHSYLVRNFFLENRLIEPGGMDMNGVGIDVGQITTPSYCVAAAGDHIVPWRGTFKMREVMGGPVRFILTKGGHIAGIINPPEKKKRAFWTNDDSTTDPDAWLDGAAEHEGSWWVDWVPWLKERSGEQVAPPSLGNEEFSPIIDAPGTYVLER